MGTSLETIIAQIHEMLTWPAGWNTYDALPISPASAVHAEAWITEVYQRDLTLVDDINVIADAWGDVVFEWWGKVKDKHLTIYIGKDVIDYVRDWGLNMETEMDDGVITSIDRFVELRQYLLA